MFLETTNTNRIKDKINEFAAIGQSFFFALSYDLSEGIFTDNPLAQSNVYFKFTGKGNKPNKKTSDHYNSLKAFPISIESYRTKFLKAYGALEQGLVKVINLTSRTLIDPGMPIEDIFIKSNSRYQIHLPGQFVCFSPERFIRISEDGIISSNPMKGTIDASIPNAEQLVLEDPKEIAEHTATTQLIVDELKKVASDVKIARFRYIDRIESKNRTLLQVSSEVTGKLPDDYKSHVGDIIFNMLPAGSIAGTPRIAALNVIAASEEEPRGYYCGIAGYFDGKILDTAVLIRFIETNGDHYYFRSGGGITKESICEKEYQEMLNKIYLPF